MLQTVPQELQLAPAQGEPARWIADPIGLDRVCDAGVQALIALPAGTPSLRLLADETAKVLAGVSHALNGLALLVVDSARPVPWRRGVLPCVPDWLPALVNAGRAFIAVGAVELFWIVTAWPNGARAITFAAIGVILLAARHAADSTLPFATTASNGRDGGNQHFNPSTRNGREAPKPDDHCWVNASLLSGLKGPFLVNAVGGAGRSKAEDRG